MIRTIVYILTVFSLIIIYGCCCNKGMIDKWHGQETTELFSGKYLKCYVIAHGDTVFKQSLLGIYTNLPGVRGTNILPSIVYMGDDTLEVDGDCWIRISMTADSVVFISELVKEKPTSNIQLPTHPRIIYDNTYGQLLNMHNTDAHFDGFDPNHKNGHFSKLNSGLEGYDLYKVDVLNWQTNEVDSTYQIYSKMPEIDGDTIRYEERLVRLSSGVINTAVKHFHIGHAPH